MPGEGAYMRPRYRVPKTDSIVITPTGYGASIRTEHYASDPIRMPGECADMRPYYHFPKTDGIVRTPACDSPSIGTEHHA